MPPILQSMLIAFVFIASAFGVHWFFMRDYLRWKRQNKARSTSAPLPHPGS
jgi:hypothetical protein